MSDYEDALFAAKIYKSFRDMYEAKRAGEFPIESEPAPTTTYNGAPSTEPEQPENGE